VCVVLGMKNYTILKILLSITICLAVGGLSGYLTSGSISTWYVGINKPSFNPPNWIFGPVWTTLYTLMGISAGLIWSKGLEFATTKKALYVFGIHLVLNFSWSLIFFGLEQPFWAFIEILFLLSSIFYFTNLFYQISPLTGWLQVPYILWVSFATTLNGAIAWLN
jgi:tryptophan-rich sensory protein